MMVEMVNIVCRLYVSFNFQDTISTIKPMSTLLPHPTKPKDGRSNAKPPNPATRRKRQKKQRYRPSKQAIRGRRKKESTRFHGAKGRYLPYSYARTFVQDHKIRTRDQYHKWIHDEEICFLTLNPQKYYDEWIGWNDYLGNNNGFDAFQKQKEVAKHFLPFWEGVALAQKICKEHNLTSSRMYRDYHKANNIKVIPRLPDRFYKDLWLGWETWLGKTVGSTTLLQQYQEQFYLIIKRFDETYSFIVTTGGKEQAKQILTQDGWVLVKAYVWDVGAANLVDRVVERACGEEEDGMRFCGNISAVIYELDTLLVTYRG